MTESKTQQSINLELSDCCKTAFRFCKIVSLKTLKTICNWKTIAIQCPDNHFNSIFWRFWFVLLKVSIWFSNNCIIIQDWLKFQQNWPSPIESINDFNFQYENYWKSNMSKTCDISLLVVVVTNPHFFENGMELLWTRYLEMHYIIHKV